MQNKKGETLLFSTLGVVIMLAILVAVNVLTSAVHERIDLTEDKAYTLSDGTRAILKKLDTPVRIRLYCTQSESATAETVYLTSYARRVEDLLAEYKQVAGKYITIEKLDPQPDSDAEDSARLDGLEPQPVPGAERFYLGLTVNLADSHETLQPFLQPNRERLLEYDLTRAITRVMSPEKPTIGLMSGLPIFGTPSNPMMAQMGQRPAEPWTLVTELRDDYNVKKVELDTDHIDADIKVLFVLHPKEITDKTQYAIDQFVLRGGKLIALVDPFSVMDNRGQGGPFGNMGGGSSNLEKLLKAWGYTLESKVVADMNFSMKVGGRGGQAEDAPAFLGITADGINKDDVASSQLDSVWMPLAGSFSGTPAAGLKETVLLHSTTNAQLVEGMMASLSGASIKNDFKPTGIAYKLAIRLNGKFKTAFPEGKPADKADEKPATEGKLAEPLKESAQESTVVLIGDADMLYDQFYIQKFDSPFGAMVSLRNGNLSLMQNLLEQMTGDNNLIAVRSRAEVSRPFTKVKAMEAAAEAKFQDEIKKLVTHRDETQRRINELQTQKQDNDQRFILSPEQRAEREKLNKEVAETEKHLKQVRKDLAKEVVSLQRELKTINILAMPAAVIAVGLAIAVIKRKKTSAK